MADLVLCERESKQLYLNSTFNPQGQALINTTPAPDHVTIWHEFYFQKKSTCYDEQHAGKTADGMNEQNYYVNLTKSPQGQALINTTPAPDHVTIWHEFYFQKTLPYYPSETNLNPKNVASTGYVDMV